MYIYIYTATQTYNFSERASLENGPRTNPTRTPTSGKIDKKFTRTIADTVVALYRTALSANSGVRVLLARARR